MAKKRNLTKEKIIQVTLLLADEIGIDKVNFSKIAEKLDIKYPSLYNHFTNMHELKIAMTIYVLNELNLRLVQGLIGKSGEEAIKQFAFNYRDFALKNKTAYELFMNVRSTENEEIERLVSETMGIIRQILAFYTNDAIYLTHKSRALRSSLHGFIALCSLGYFKGKANLEDSFQFMIDDFIFSLSRSK